MKTRAEEMMTRAVRRRLRRMGETPAAKAALKAQQRHEAIQRGRTQLEGKTALEQADIIEAGIKAYIERNGVPHCLEFHPVALLLTKTILQTRGYEFMWHEDQHLISRPEWRGKAPEGAPP